MFTNYVSIIIPCRNEERHIQACLDSILEQDYPKDQLEILVADGMSTDKTRDILKRYAAQYPFIRWFDNPQKIVPTGLNVLIREAKGNIIIRMDAHTDYLEDYVSQCVHHLMESQVDNVGGICVTLPESNSPVAQAIALALSSPFGVGNSSFRIGVSEPQLVDTVPFGCFKREVFDRIGLFDEDLVRNQDDELNSRLIKSGGKILLVPKIVSKYYARGSYKKLWRMYFQYGYFKPLTIVKLGGVMTWRQLIPALFISSLIFWGITSLFSPFCQWLFFLEGGLYILGNLAASLGLALRRGILLLPYLMAAFLVIHFGYGLGYMKGIYHFLILKRHLKNKVNDMALSR